jgi:hypothetical protein
MASSVGPTPSGEFAVDKQKMYTGDPYAGMEVHIQAGHLKNFFATVKGTRTVNGAVLAIIRTDTLAVNHMSEINIEDLRERQ